MGAEHFGSDMRNGRRLPGWRLAVCRQLGVPDFLLRCRESEGDVEFPLPRWKSNYLVYINVAAGRGNGHYLCWSVNPLG